ncbi:hypothetical protein CEV32_4329 [Brucella rhizosphaerae]|uniref:Uncharacterized protein n=1 Tax=Brucella rhizosphaerae TaxID=571254 RepID=A0A256FPB5_9HYPH|nr:hypothetical protein CEV32_4329 [Brucella rhizosphaerae]
MTAVHLSWIYEPSDGTQTLRISRSQMVNISLYCPTSHVA